MRDDIIDHGFMRAFDALDRDIGTGIDRIAFIDEPLHCRAGVTLFQQRAVVAAGHTAHQDVKIGAQPDRCAARGDVPARARVHESAAAGGQHFRAFVQQTGNDAAFAFAEGSLAAAFENFRDGFARSISTSASTKSSPSRWASRRPTVVLPAPIKPTSTIERSTERAGSGVKAGACASEARSGVCLAGDRGSVIIILNI